MAKLFIAALLGAALATAVSAKTNYRFTTLDSEYSVIGAEITAKVIKDAADGRCFLIVFASHDSMAVGPEVPCTR